LIELQVVLIGTFMRVNKKRYLGLLNILKEEAQAIGTKVFIYKKKQNDRLPHGRFSASRNKISVFTQESNDYLKTLFIFAHELRHAQHLKFGLFKDYYDFRKYDTKRMQYLLEHNPMKVPLPDLRCGLRAEEDCYRFARNWLDYFGADVSLSIKNVFLYEPYPKEHLASYPLYELIKEKRRSFKKKKV
jgi:hypothetical protein